MTQTITIESVAVFALASILIFGAANLQQEAAAGVPLTVQDVIKKIEDATVPETESGDKLEDVAEKLATAQEELDKDPSDNQAALGNMEGAAGDLEAAVEKELIDSGTGNGCLDDLASIAKGIATAAIADAKAAGGDIDKIAEAEGAVMDGMTLQEADQFKDAIAQYKDAVSKAEGA